MSYDPSRHHRRSIRLQGFDYSQAGLYYVTIVTEGRLCLFGKVENSQMRPNAAGEVAERWWLALTEKYPTVELDEYRVMPNHLHGIVRLCGPHPDDIQGPRIGFGAHNRPVSDYGRLPVDGDVDPGAQEMPTDCPEADTRAPLSDLVQWFKSMTTNEYIRGVKTRGWRRFRGRLWQRNYYEHIIRSDESLERIRQYIVDNPMRWELDRENPEATKPEPEGTWFVYGKKDRSPRGR